MTLVDASSWVEFLRGRDLRMSLKVLFTTGLLVLAAAMASCSKSPSGGGVDLRSGLIAQWPGPTNTSAGSLQPSLTGAVAMGPGKFGAAYVFEGTTGRVVVPHSQRLNFGADQDFSIAAWIKPMALDTSFGVMDILDKRKVNSIVGAQGYCLALENGRLGCQLAPAVPPFKLSDLTSLDGIRAAWQRREQVPALAFANFKSTTPDLRDGQYHQVAVTVQRRSPTGGKLWVDGEVVLTFDPTRQAASLANDEPLLIGTHPDPGLRCPYRGSIEDVRLYSRALSPAEVKALSRPSGQN